ncbi:MAG: DUF3667 domain-containing protein, partial [Opitutales bacterium]|nr:DUF3667 domain-containing protein [Opitutales bacterium]
DFKKDWGGIVNDVLSSCFNFEGKLLRGLFHLTFMPWKVTKSFLEGKRISQIPPLRTYLFVSLIFFVSLSSDRDSTYSMSQADRIEVKQSLEDSEMSPIGLWFLDELQDGESLESKFFKILPKAFMIGVFFIAFVFWLLFRKYQYVYIEHLVVALNLQTHTFLWITFTDGWSSLLEPFIAHIEIVLDLFALGWLCVCPILLIKKVYELSYRASIAYMVLIQFIWGVYLIFSFVCVLILSIMLL